VDEAERALRESLDRARKLRDRGAERAATLELGLLALARGDGAAATPLLEHARDAARAARDGALEARANEALARGAPRSLDLAALEPAALATLVEAGIAAAGSATPGMVVAQRLHALLGAAGVRVLLAGREVGRAGEPVDEGSVTVTEGERTLVLSPAPGRLPGEREATIARALLGHVRAGTGTDARILALIERVLEAPLELEHLARVATDLAVEATGAARGLLLVREPGAKLGFTAARRAGEDLPDPAGVASRTLVREAFLSGRAILLADAASDPEHRDRESIGARGLRSVLVAPIPGPDGAAGVLYLDDPGVVARFGPAERDLAVGFAARLGGPLRVALERARERAAATSAREAVCAPTRGPDGFPTLIGTSPALGAVLTLLEKAAATTAPVLISGESGTGKELAARALHERSGRAAGPFEAVSCGSLADGVLESELFGHAAGAFTGAGAAHRGAFERADGGTLFLDELQDASPKLQAELLRALETGEVRPLGAERPRRVSVRITCATNVDLAALVAAGSFREDLWFRVNVLQVKLPPLRERPGDVPLLAAHLLGNRGRLGTGALERLVAHAWPGNVRELRNCLERALTLAAGGTIRAEHVVLDEPRRPPPPRAAVYTGAIDLNERQLALIEKLRTSGELASTDHARELGISQPTAWRDLAELVAKGVVQKIARGKKTTYVLAPGWEDRLHGTGA
jgi:DNA-binding NtrC family response regulator